MEILQALPILFLVIFRLFSVAQTTDNTTEPQNSSMTNSSMKDSAGGNVDDKDYERNNERKRNTTEIPTTTECSSCLECYNCHLSIECAKTVGMTTEKCGSGIPCSSMEREYAGYLYIARGCADKSRPPRCQNETLDGSRFLVCDCDTDLCNHGHCHFQNGVFAIILFEVWSLGFP